MAAAAAKCSDLAFLYTLGIDGRPCTSTIVFELLSRRIIWNKMVELKQPVYGFGNKPNYYYYTPMLIHCWANAFLISFNFFLSWASESSLYQRSLVHPASVVRRDINVCFEVSMWLWLRPIDSLTYGGGYEQPSSISKMFTTRNLSRTLFADVSSKKVRWWMECKLLLFCHSGGCHLDVCIVA